MLGSVAPCYGVDIGNCSDSYPVSSGGRRRKSYDKYRSPSRLSSFGVVLARILLETMRGTTGPGTQSLVSP
jgi:hypothetical protein